MHLGAVHVAEANYVHIYLSDAMQASVASI